MAYYLTNLEGEFQKHNHTTSCKHTVSSEAV